MAQTLHTDQLPDASASVRSQFEQAMTRVDEASTVAMNHMRSAAAVLGVSEGTASADVELSFGTASTATTTTGAVTLALDRDPASPGYVLLVFPRPSWDRATATWAEGAEISFHDDGVTDPPFGVAAGPMATKTHEATIEVDVPLRTAYDQWTQFEEFPKFMDGVNRVTQVADDRTHWEVAVGGLHREFDAEIVEQHPDEVVAWRSLDGPTHNGEVRFEPIGQSRTRVDLRMEVEPEGIAEKAGEALGVVDHRIKADLERFKAFIETIGAQTGGWRGHIS